ncbi:MAG TPA: hypothetical protein VHJ19_12145 [Gammaproteobacteria bacterium]|nr:hypothetical protein [Gammaproteobacteria bacterium]
MFTRSKSKRQQMADAAREAADRGAEAISEVERRARAISADAQDALRDSARKARQRSSEAYGDLADIVHDYPLVTIAIALAVGALAASLLRR